METTTTYMRAPHPLRLGPTTVMAVLATLLSLGVGILPSAESPLPNDPVPVDQVPGFGVAGTVVVDDGDPAVACDPPAKPSKVPAPPECSPTHGGTGLSYNGYNQVGDGKATLTVEPKLPAGRYAVWLRFVRMERNFHGNAPKAGVLLRDKAGVWEYACSPRQGGQWVLLGVHDLAGGGAVLTLRNADMKGVAMFDAAAFVPAGVPSTPPSRFLPEDGSGFARVIRRAADVAIGPTEIPPSDAAIAQRLRARDFRARLAWDTLIRTPDRTRLWGDSLQTASYLLTEDASRIAAMAAAWAGASEIDGMGLRGNPRLLADTIAALDTFLTHRWTPTTKWDVNWWDFEIGVPRGVLAALCILGPNVTPELKAKAFASMEHFTVDPWKMYNKGAVATGANRIWMVANHLRRAALAGDAKGMDRCRDGLPEVMAFVDADPANMPKSRDGWWRDGSFIQHRSLPYVGAYGVLLIPDLIECMALLEGTPWEVKGEERANMAHWVDDHLLPVVYEGELFPRTTGRTAGSPGIETCHQWLAIALCELRPFLPKAQADLVTARLRRWMENGGLSAERIERADFRQFLTLHAIGADPSVHPADPYVASRTHAAVDLALHHRPGWAASVAMSSTRTLSHEALWGANYRGWKQGDGVLMVYPGDPLRYREGFWALVDPYRLPGITTSTWKLPDHDGAGGSSGKPSQQDFVGGASLDDFASVACMRVGRDGSTLDARKAWFLLPDAIVCLGSGITSADGQPCETIVESARLGKGDLALAVDGKVVPPGAWKADLGSARTLHLAGTSRERAMGWWFPQPPKGLAGERGDRTGSWRNAMKTGSEAPIVQPWLSLILSHGIDPRDASYQYALLPGISAEQLATFAAKPSLEVLACTPQAHAVRDEAHGLTGAVFWEAGSAGPFTVDQPCVVVLRESKEGVALAVADPTQKLAALGVVLKLKLGRPLSADPGVKVGAGDPVRVDFDLVRSLGYERVVRWGP